MTEKLLSRLDALAEVAAGVRDKIRGRDAGQLDGLSVARLLVAVDAAAKRLGKLADELQPALFPAAGDNGQGSAGQETARRRK
ncbi:MAG: hypothetical protein ACRELG_12725 [Gemmataceae bacterium]